MCWTPLNICVPIIHVLVCKSLPQTPPLLLSDLFQSSKLLWVYMLPLFLSWCDRVWHYYDGIVVGIFHFINRNACSALLDMPVPNQNLYLYCFLPLAPLYLDVLCLSLKLLCWCGGLSVRSSVLDISIFNSLIESYSWLTSLWTIHQLYCGSLCYLWRTPKKNKHRV